MNTCPFCAEDIPDTAVVCKQCGRTVADAMLSRRLWRPVKTSLYISGALIAFWVLGNLMWPAMDSPDAASLLLVSESQRAKTLHQIMKRVARLTDENCDRVTRTFFQGDTSSGDAFWDVECANRNRFAIIVAKTATGSTRVMTCVALEIDKKVPCFEKFHQ